MTESHSPSGGERVRHQHAYSFWSSDWSLTVLLVLLVGNIFTLPLFQFDPSDRLISRVGLSLIIISGMIATVRSRWLVLLVSAFTLLDLFVGWEDVAHPSSYRHLLNDVVALPLIVLLLVLVVRQIFREGPITMRRVQGSIAVYLLIGIVWAVAYDMLEALQPGSFSVARTFHGTGLAELGYYSFTTLTTLGVGDILPQNPIARSLTVLEALVGQLFPAILIARLVAMELAYRGYQTGAHRE